MDVTGTEPSAFGLDDPVAGAAATAEWLEIIKALSASMPDERPDLWLGRLVLEAQRASDRAVVAARGQADSILAEARAEALALREAGRRRAYAVERVRAVIQQTASPIEQVGTYPFPRPPEAKQAPPTATERAATERAATERAATERAATERAATERAATDSPTRSGPPPPSTTVPVTAPGLATTVPTESQSLPARLHVKPLALVAAAAIFAAVVGLVIFERSGTGSFERGSQRQLAAQFARAEAVHRSAPPAHGAPFAQLTIPRIAMSQVVVEGATLSDLGWGPAHVATSQMPGQRGAVVILGHRRTYGAPFARLAELRIGDVITMRTATASYRYRVSRSPQIMRPGGNAALVLPSATEVAAARGRTDHVDQALVLGTSADFNGGSMEVVVATLDQAGAASSPAGISHTAVITQLRSVPGQRVGLLLLVLWLVIIVEALLLARRFKLRIPTRLLYAATSVVVVVAVYQLYLAVDRLMPGTY